MDEIYHKSGRYLARHAHIHIWYLTYTHAKKRFERERTETLVSSTQSMHRSSRQIPDSRPSKGEARRLKLPAQARSNLMIVRERQSLKTHNDEFKISKQREYVVAG